MKKEKTFVRLKGRVAHSQGELVGLWFVLVTLLWCIYFGLFVVCGVVGGHSSGAIIHKVVLLKVFAP